MDNEDGDDDEGVEMTNIVDEVLKINLMRINKVYGIF